ncbi:hypothetical protein RRG08_054465 [Elysia crispata]|uniref:Uncharacterized protein n=1 Tax=Elysia crispata TaxID=231223 RepID=A0AAE1CTK7_9GAST|nr:hypothetical protein RRG08_054465 [Elysia crispata]
MVSGNDNGRKTFPNSSDQPQVENELIQCKTLFAEFIYSPEMFEVCSVLRSDTKPLQAVPSGESKPRHDRRKKFDQELAQPC